MNFLRKDQIPDLCVSALRPFTYSSHEFIRHYVTDKMFSVNKLILAPTSSSAASSTSLTSLRVKPPDELDPLVILQGLETLYITLKQQNNYPPGEQISSDKKLKAMQSKVKKLKDELGKLSQDRSASSTRSSNHKSSSTGPIKNKKGELVECFNCKGNHYKKDCPTLGSTGSNSNGSNSSASPSNSSSNSGSGSGSTKVTGSGLSPEVDKKTSAAIKTKMETLPPRENVPDDAKHTVSVDGTVTAKYCRHHGKFTRGKSAHFTPDCKLPDHKKFAFVPRAAGNMALVSPDVSTSPSPAPNREPSDPANHLMIPCGPRTYFDFSNMPALERPKSNLATVDEASEGDFVHDWVAMMSKDYGEH